MIYIDVSEKFEVIADCRATKEISQYRLEYPKNLVSLKDSIGIARV
jgi:hypothetical protein